MTGYDLKNLKRELGGAGAVRVVHFDDIDYTVLAKPGAAWVDFQCYRITSADADGTPGDPRWYGENAGSFHTGGDGDATRPLEWDDARVGPTLAGAVKWDGCSDFNLGARHFCGRSPAVAVGILLDRLYDATLCLIDCHDAALFEGGDLHITTVRRRDLTPRGAR